MTVATRPRFTGKHTGLPSPVHAFADTGAWHQWCNPKGTHRDGVLFFGYIDESFRIRFRQYDIATRTLSSAFTARTLSDNDHHATPAITIVSDHLLAIYGTHVGGSMWKRASSSLDVSTFGSETDIGSGWGLDNLGYPNILRLDNGNIWLVFRNAFGDPGDTRSWYYSISTNGGSTWSAPVKFWENSNEASYLVAGTDGVAVHFGVIDKSPSQVVSVNLGHFYWDGTWHKSDGTSIGSPPFDASDDTHIAAGAIWPWDIHITDDGIIRIAYDLLAGTDDQRHKVARWDGSSWDVREVDAYGDGLPALPGDSTNYPIGLVIDRYDPHILYGARQVSGVHQIYRYVTADDETWNAGRLTTGGTDRSYVGWVEDPPPTIRAMWQTGTYTDYLTWSVDLEGGGGGGVGPESAGEEAAIAALEALAALHTEQIDDLDARVTDLEGA